MTVTARLPRPRLGHLLRAARSSRLTTVIAPAGYGKTTLLADWADRIPLAWHRVVAADREAQPLLRGLADDLRAVLPGLRFRPPDVLADNELAGEAGLANQSHALAALLCDAVSDAAASPILLVLDDVHLISPVDPASSLLEALCRQAPPSLRIVMSSRDPVLFAVRRMRRDGELLEITAAQLTFTESEIGELTGDPGLATAVHQATGGWPVAVRMVADALQHGTWADPQGALRPLARSRELFDYLAREVFDSEPETARELVRVSAMFDRVSADLLGGLGFPQSRGSTTWQILGFAHEIRGEWGSALACLRRAARQVEGLTSILAMRIASMHYFSSAPAEALAVFEQCQLTGPA